MSNDARGKSRIGVIDMARSLALAAMAVYHFTWDLEFFGHVTRGLTLEPGWKLFARCIASSFLILAGVSLVLAHQQAIRWKPFGLRFAMVAGAALVITVATWFMFPDAFIYFGILHQIALASLLGLAFLRLPWPVTAAIAATVIALPFFWRSETFAHPALLWTGLAPVPRHSNDYVPLCPWFGAFLAGMALAKLWLAHAPQAWRERLTSVHLPGWLTWPGRHSLAVYLVHQPLLIGLVWAWTQLFPPSMTIAEAEPACLSQCLESRDDAFCRAYCTCLLDALDAKGILFPVMSGNANEEQIRQTVEERDICLAGQSQEGR